MLKVGPNLVQRREKTILNFFNKKVQVSKINYGNQGWLVGGQELNEKLHFRPPSIQTGVLVGAG